MSAIAQTLPAPAVAPVAAGGKWQREYEAFFRLKPQLMASHAGEYVAIHDGQVVASGSDDVALALQFFAQHGNVPVHIGLVSAGQEPGARIPHYREVNPRGAA
jgi:hypothetical protein